MADLLTEFGLIELVRHLQQLLQFWNPETWTQFKQGAVLLSRYDYILGTDWRRFKIAGIQDMRNYMSDHLAIWKILLRCQTRCHT